MSKRKAAMAKKLGYSVPRLTRPDIPIPSREEPTPSTSTTGDNKKSLENKFYKRKKEITDFSRTDSVEVNLFKMTIAKDFEFYHYNIEILGEKGVEPPTSSASKRPPKSKRVKKVLNDVVFKQIFQQHKSIFKTKVLPVFDGEKNFYSLNKFDLENGIWEGQVEIKTEEDTRTKIISVKITTPENSNFQNFKNILKDDSSEIMPVEQQALDIILKNGGLKTKVMVGSNMFSKKLAANEAEIFHIWSKTQNINNPFLHGRFGTYQATKICEKDLYLNVDQSIQLFNDGGKLLTILNKLKYGGKFHSDKTEYYVESEKKVISSNIKGLKFRALHLGRIFRINGITKINIKKTTFRGENGDTNVYEYFRQKYSQNFPSLNPTYPCVEVVANNKSKNYYPLECVEILQDQVYKRKLDASIQEVVTKKSCQKPTERFYSIKRHVDTLKKDNIVKNYLNHFGNIEIDNKPEVVRAGIIDAPTIQFGDLKFLNPTEKGEFDISRKKTYKFYQPVKGIKKDWAVINFKTNTNVKENVFRNFVHQLVTAARERGMEFETPKEIKPDFVYNKEEKTIEKEFARLKEKNIKFVLIIIPDEFVYSEIKATTEITGYIEKIITQCLNQDKQYWKQTIENMFQDKLILNILLKINTKLGGINHTIQEGSRSPLMRSSSKEKIMFVGIDVTHPSPTDKLRHSISACVATCTDDYVKCLKDIKVQEKARKEVVNLKNTIKKFLEEYRSANKYYPSKIIVYRDGIGEGDFQKINDIEFAGIKDACKELKQEIKVTYIMVQKRHNIRFKRKDKVDLEGGKSSSNLLPGTLIDQIVCSKKFFEFYLCAHFSGMGTARPGKYVVIQDENGFDYKELYKITFHTCFLYPRCLKTISIPSFVEYAHHLCTRGRHYLRILAPAKTRPLSQSTTEDESEEEITPAKINTLNQKMNIRQDLSQRTYFI